MTTPFAILAVFVVSGVVAFFFVGFQLGKKPAQWIGKKRDRPNKATSTIVFLGDSLTHGRIGYDYVSDIAEKMGASATILNAGVNADLTHDVLGRLELVISSDPDRILILIGTNDALLSEDPEIFRNNYRKIVDTLSTRTRAKLALLSLPFLSGPPDSEFNLRVEAHSRFIRELAAERTLEYIPVHEAFQEWRQNHPDQKDRFTLQPPFPGFTGAMKFGFRHFVLGESLENISRKKGGALTIDGIHLNETGGRLLSQTILKSLRQEIRGN